MSACFEASSSCVNALAFASLNYQVLRRSAVTLLNAECNADPTVVAAQMGHTVDVSTNVYNKVDIQRQRNAVQKLDDALTPKTLQRAS